MPKSQLDWLGVVSLWTGALLLAIKSAAVPLMAGAPTFLAAGFWNYVPLLLISIAVGIFIYRQLRPATAELAPATGASEPQLSPKERTLLSLQNVRTSIEVALFQRDDDSHERTYHEVEAVMLSIARQFDIKMLRPCQDGDYTGALETYGAYIDRFYPMLLEGHVTAARVKAAEFRRKREA